MSGQVRLPQDAASNRSNGVAKGGTGREVVA